MKKCSGLKIIYLFTSSLTCTFSKVTYNKKKQVKNKSFHEWKKVIFVHAVKYQVAFLYSKVPLEHWCLLLVNEGLIQKNVREHMHSVTVWEELKLL